MGKKLGLDKQYSSLLTSVNKNSPTNLMTNSTGNTLRSKAMNLAGSKVGKTAKFIMGRTPIGKAVNLAINVGSGIGIGYSYAKNKFNKKKADFQKGDYSDIKTDKKMAGGMMQGYGAARTSGMGLEDQSLPPGKMVRANTGKMLNFKSDKERKDYTKQAIASLEGITESFKDKLNPMKAQRLLDRLPKKKIKKVKMNKGGGMDMGKKEEPTQWITKKEKPTQWITKKEKPTQWITKKEKPKKWITKKSRGGGMDMGQMPNTVKPEPRGNPGIVENVVGKGGDYIKDLID